MLVIQDQHLVQQLQRIAEQEHRSPEAVLQAMVALYTAQMSHHTPSSADVEMDLQRFREKIYNKARAYWQSVGDTAKATLTNEELLEQFGAFDEEGIPRLKSELTVPPPVGTLAHLAEFIAERGGIEMQHAIDPTTIDDILHDEFADYLAGRMENTNE